MPVIVHLSDVHFGSDVEGLPESLIDDIAGHPIDLVVVSGDLTQRARSAQFRTARAFLDQLPAPCIAVVGNHDLPLVNLLRRVLSPTGSYERFITEDLNPVVVLPLLVVVGLDSMPRWRWKAGHISRGQSELVRRALGGAPAGAWRLLVTHHPILPAHLSGLIGRGLLTAACADAGVAMLFAGHTHAASAGVVTLGRGGEARTALAEVAGTATIRRTRGTPNGYTVIDLSGPMTEGTELAVTFRERDGMRWSTAGIARFVYTETGVVACAAT